MTFLKSFISRIDLLLGVVFSLLDISQSRLDFAKELGADCTVLTDTKDGEVMADKVKEAMGDMPDITIECSGAQSAIQLAIYVSDTSM